MAKLYFRYGAMNSGKSTALLQVAFNYEERGQRVIIGKPKVDTKAADQISSRLGVKRTADFLIDSQDSIRNLIAANVVANPHNPLACVLIDEAQFLTPRQIDELFKVAVLDDIPVLAYGIRTDFRTVAFPGSQRLLEIAHSLEELKTICRCGKKAILNGRMVNGEFVFAGNQVAIDGEEVTYESLCGACHLAKSGGLLASDLIN